MYSIRLIELNDFVNNPGSISLGELNPFCFKCISKKNEKCISFYRSLCDLNNPRNGLLACPFGYNCYVPKDNCQAVLTSIMSEKSNIKKIRQRNKIYRYKQGPILESKHIIEQFEKYNKFLFTVSVGNNICHDLNNAINYLIVLAETLDSNDDEIKNNYQQIIQKVSIIQENATFDRFELDSEFNDSSLLLSFKKLNDDVDKYYRTAEKTLKSIDPEREQNRYCVYAGISLIRTLLRRNLMMMDGAFKLGGQQKSFSLHQMVMKIIILLRYRASNKSVRFPHFVGSPRHRVVGQIDDIFTAIFTLIDNSIKYSHKNSDIYISFDDKESSVTLSIANSSDYLSEYDLEHIHDKFYRGSNMSQKGQGLGLYMVKMICDNNNIKYNVSYEKEMFIYKLTFSNVCLDG